MVNRNQRKRQFLQWLLHHFKHQNPVVNHFLQFLMTEPNCIQYVSFTEACDYSPRGIYISYLTHTDTPFIYYKQNKAFTKCEQAFHDFRLNAQMSREQFYIEIDIPNVYAVLYEFDIFEENPYLPIEQEKIDEVEQVLEQLTVDAQIKNWQELIDEGLAQHNYEQVEYYLQLIEKARGKQR
ncbi:YpiB family protein [Tuanshanicoccus lijuaniae]|uniref:YpiB family protein n=1 Tax=Aerococcaceae bacterium zg-1292 TaxID=2774330 RepID=UPI0019374B80|nr:YpiB family protein [Aerococcaceae bacterium zg-1292]MBF6625597.1 YpiB family protein [Aerococcaceae bacterium zg-BR9]MBF6977780.1 YpiB family protein [Aerococcaceae bacterium zg-BR22]MBS4456008.1 YpiB family protein [Aerococcaceae bacterium zg-A91]MBS4457760.1 YpiB family protein [Aerococcaceae bacterium zg-BR33]